MNVLKNLFFYFFYKNLIKLIISTINSTNLQYSKIAFICYSTSQCGQKARDILSLPPNLTLHRELRMKKWKLTYLWMEMSNFESGIVRHLLINNVVPIDGCDGLLIYRHCTIIIISVSEGSGSEDNIGRKALFGDFCTAHDGMHKYWKYSTGRRRKFSSFDVKKWRELHRKKAKVGIVKEKSLSRVSSSEN